VRNYKPKTIIGYAKNLSMLVNWAETQGATTLADLDTDLVKCYIRYLQEKPKYAERGYATVSAERVSASAIRNYVCAVH
jgi:site-specific recombinase XerD